ncbi:MAG: tetratricopeptide repeat protein [Bradymonadales bacterium]
MNSSHIQWEIAKKLIQVGYFDSALEYLEKLESDASIKQSELYREITLCHIYKNNRIQAYYYAKLLYFSNLQNSEAKAIYGFCIYNYKKLKHGLQLLSEAFNDNPDDYHINLLYGITKIRLNQPKEALEYLHYAATNPNKTPYPDEFLAKAYAKLKQYDFAILHLNKALKLHPNNAKYSAKLAKYYIKIGDSDKALEHIDFAITHSPHKAEFYYILAQALIQTKRHVEAFFAASAAAHCIHCKEKHVILYFEYCIAYSRFEDIINYIIHREKTSPYDLYKDPYATFAVIALASLDSLTKEKRNLLNTLIKRINSQTKILIQYYIKLKSAKNSNIKNIKLKLGKISRKNFTVCDAYLLARIEIQRQSNKYHSITNKILKSTEYGELLLEQLNRYKNLRYSQSIQKCKTDNIDLETYAIAESFYNYAAKILSIKAKEQNFDGIDAFFRRSNASKILFELKETPEKFSKRISDAFYSLHSATERNDERVFTTIAHNTKPNEYEQAFWQWAKKNATLLQRQLKTASRLMETGKDFEARAYLKALQQRYSYVPAVYLWHAKCLQRLGAKDSALQTAVNGSMVLSDLYNNESILSLRKLKTHCDPEICQFSADLLLESNNVAFALNMMLLSLQLSPHHLRTAADHIELAQTFLKFDKSKAAQLLLVQAITQFPQNSDLLSFILRHPEIYKDSYPSLFFPAATIMANTQSSSPHIEEILRNFLRLGMESWATYAYRKKINQDHGPYQSFFRALLYLNRDKYNAALKCLDKCCETYPKFSEAYIIKAWIYLQKKHAHAAERELNSVLALDFDSLQLRMVQLQHALEYKSDECFYSVLHELAQRDILYLFQCLASTEFDAVWKKIGFREALIKLAPYLEKL